MALSKLIKTFSWTQYSQKLCQHLEQPRSCGYFTEKDASSCGLKLVVDDSGSIQEGNYLRFYWLVDPSDGIIVDARFQMIGEAVLIGLAETACILTVGKNYDQAARLTVGVVENFLVDSTSKEYLFEGSIGHVSLVIEALQKCAHHCLDIPVAQSYISPPVNSSPIEGDGYPGFKKLKLSQKIEIINQVLDQEVRPYVEMDAGGVEVIGLDGNQVTIAYQGTCTSCYSATGATLSFIQQVVKAKVDPDLEVHPDL